MMLVCSFDCYKIVFIELSIITSQSFSAQLFLCITECIYLHYPQPPADYPILPTRAYPFMQ